MELSLETGKFDLSDISTGDLLTDLILNGVFTAFEQLEDETSPITGIRVFDIVTVSYGRNLYHLVRKHNGLNAGSPHIAWYVNELYIYKKLDDAEAKLRHMINEFLDGSK